MKFRKKNSKNGFTLVELMIVMSIVVIISTILIPQFEFTILKAHHAKAKGTLAAARTCVNMAFTDRNEYLYKDQEGSFVKLADTILPKYIDKYPLPVLKDPFPLHGLIIGQFDVTAQNCLALGKDLYITNRFLDPDTELSTINAIYVYNNMEGSLIIANVNTDTGGNMYGSW